MKTIAIRLGPGEDLKQRLAGLADDKRLDAACILTCVGSLSRAAIRFAGKPGPTLMEGKFEILSLSGTFSRHGAHVHITVADAEGSVTGGHLCEGCEIRTTAEIVVGLVPGVVFRRTKDERTGFHELDIERK